MTTRPTKMRQIACVLLSLIVPAAGHAYKPEVGSALPPLAVVQTGGKPIDWRLAGGAVRIVVVSAAWCPPCQEFKASIPNQLARLRRAGIEVSVIVIDADNFNGASGVATNRHAGLNAGGYIDAVPDPGKIDLKAESPRGVRDFGAFRVYGYPTTILLDSDNVVVDRYRGGTASDSVFDDAIALGKRLQAGRGNVSPTAATTPLADPAAPQPLSAARRATIDAAADDLIGVWRMRIPEGLTTELVLRVVGVTPGVGGRDKVEASLARKLTSWAPIEATSEGDGASRTFRFTTNTGGRVEVVRQPDGGYAGTLVRSGTRVPPRRIWLERISDEDAEI